MKKCPCGSGQPRRELFDGYNIHLCFVCDECEKRKLAKFRPDIFTRYPLAPGERIEPED